MDTQPDPAFDARLAELRTHLKSARDERGGCPPWDELRADLLPGGKSRPGREARLAHRAMCPYCESHVREWQQSVDHAADRLEAVERGFVRGLAGGARGLVKRIAGGGAPARPAPAADVAPVTPATRTANEAPATNEAPRARAPRRAPAAAAPTSARASASPAITRLLVVEMVEPRQPPESVFLCAAALDADVAVVPTLRELEDDPDLGLVIAIVLAGARPAAEWPGAVRAARALVPGRPVVLLAAYGVEATAGARRMLGDALLPEECPAERLLLALDHTLR